MTLYNKPLPVRDRDSLPFWDAARQRQLVVQKCSTCGTFRWPPGPICFRCQSIAVEWMPSSGRGHVYSWIVVHQALAGFEDEVPYAVVVVDLDDAPGVRLYGHLVGCKPENIYGNMPVSAFFEDATSEITLVKFRPA